MPDLLIRPPVAGAEARLRTPWLESLVILAFVVLARAPALPPSVIDWDESLYILTARALLHGQLPYVAVFDNKPLGAPSLLALAMALLGETVPAVRLAGTIGVAATALLLGAIARRAALPRGAGVAAAILYTAFSTRLGGLSTNTELLFAPFTTAAILVALGAAGATSTRAQARAMAEAGLLLGIGIWIKTVVCLPAVVLFVALGGSWLLQRRASPLRLAALALPFGVLCVAPTLATAVFYWANGAADAFWYSNFGFMSVYLALALPPGEMARTTVASLLEIWPLIALSVLAGGLAARKAGALRFFAVTIALWTMTEAAAVVAPWKFYPHYFLVLLPPLSLLAGTALAIVVQRSVIPDLRPPAAPVLAVCIGLVPLAQVAGLLTPGWLNLGGRDVPRRVAAIIRNDPEPGATAWVVNSEPVIYFLAGVEAPTRFPFPPHLVGAQSALARVDPVAEIERIMATHPRYLVIDSGRWDEVEPALRPIIRAALKQYRLADSIPSHPSPVEVWRFNPAAPPPAAAGR